MDIMYTQDYSVMDSSEGRKDDEGKLDILLLPFTELLKVLEVLEYGAKKYGRNNWRNVQNPRTRYLNAAFRHLCSYARGFWKDDESGYSHLAHAACCILFLLNFEDKNETK